jgi:hypothetical protein
LYHGEQVVLGRNWPAVVFKYDLKCGDMLEFKSKEFGLEMTIYKHNGSTARTYVCPDHG